MNTTIYSNTLFFSRKHGPAARDVPLFGLLTLFRPHRRLLRLFGLSLVPIRRIAAHPEGVQVARWLPRSGATGAAHQELPAIRFEMLE